MRHSNNNTKSRKNKHLTYEERLAIERWWNKDKRTKVEIANLLDRNEKTIRLEIKKGLTKNLTSDWIEIEVYSADIAHKKYLYNLGGKGPQLKIGNNFKLKEFIEVSIKKDKMSPEAIVATKEFKAFNINMSAKTIRNNIAQGGIYRIKRKDMIYNKKTKVKNPEKKICEKIPPEKSIEKRPIEADTMSERGHWEGDLVIGKKTKGAVLFTLTERKLREEIILKIPSKRCADVAKALDKLEKRYKSNFREKFKTITFDNGAEFRDWRLLEKSCDGRRKKPRTHIYYAHPYCSGERGSNENNNRLIRRFIPKCTDITPITEEFIAYIENWINNYPRAIFNYKSTNQILEELSL